MHTKRVMHRGEAQYTKAHQNINHYCFSHKDLKPANIFLTIQGTVKLGDLGLSRFFGNSTMITFSLVGTPYYMSPERIKEYGYDFKSDIWSLGCILYEVGFYKIQATITFVDVIKIFI